MATNLAEATGKAFAKAVQTWRDSHLMLMYRQPPYECARCSKVYKKAAWARKHVQKTWHWIK